MTLQDTFTDIYVHKRWGDGESVSGPNGTLTRTRKLRRSLRKTYDKYKIESVFDAPCGDHNWMRAVNYDGMRYMGADIVPELVASNSNKYATDNKGFMWFDLTTCQFPKADLWFCRACLNHLSTEDVRKVLTSFVNSDIKYVLLTAHHTGNANDDKPQSDVTWKDIDWHCGPWFFPDPLECIQDCFPPVPERYMHLYTREQVAGAIE